METSGLPEAACFRTIEQALNKVEADVVVVITPPDLHYEMCLEAVRAGKHVLVEKPFTKSLANSKHVVEEAKKHGVKVCVSQNAKYSAAQVTLARLLREEVYGKASFGMFLKLSWREKGVHHSGKDDHAYLWERGIHDFDTLRYVLGDPKRMWAHSFNPPWSPYKAGAGAHAYLEFESGVTCGYLCCFESHKDGSLFRVDCEGGTLEIDGKKLTLKHREKDAEEAVPLDPCPDSTTVILNEFRRYLADGVEPEFSGRHNLKTVAMIEGLGISSDEGRMVTLKEMLG
jgi:predicted dehydrogenase